MTSNIQPRLRQYRSALAIICVGKSRGGLAYSALRYGRLPLLVHMHIWDLLILYKGRIYIYGGTYSTTKYGVIYVYIYLIYIYIYLLKYCGPPADGGHPGGRRTGGHPGGQRTGGRYTTDRHTCLRYGGREDTEGAPTWRQGKVYQQMACALFWSDRPNPAIARRG